MFTGIIEYQGEILEVSDTDKGKRFAIAAPDGFGAVKLGDSIAVMGCCLTQAVEFEGKLVFDVIPESLRKTSLDDFQAGQLVHLEKAMTADTLISGHFVQGHIDAIGRVSHVQDSEDWRLSIAIGGAQLPLMIPKGSVTIDGVSLTIAEVDPKSATFTVALIPTTLDKTQLGRLKLGDRVNLETDMLVRSVVHTVNLMGLTGSDKAGKQADSGSDVKEEVTMAFLEEAGFLKQES